LREDLKEAILHSFVAREKAAEMQIERGIIDTGKRSQVTSGRHLDMLTDLIVKDLIKCGISSDDIYSKNKGTELPGWFRATKKWDILGFCDSRLVTAIEMKSIYSSYGNNLNNRAEEAIGGAVDAKYALNNELLNQSIPPVFGYILIVRKDDVSAAQCRDPNEPHFRADVEFFNKSYVERFLILCRRLRREAIYGAVWFVVADPEKETVEELDPDLSYESFIAEIRGKTGVFSPTAK